MQEVVGEECGTTKATINQNSEERSRTETERLFGPFDLCAIHTARLHGL